MTNQEAIEELEYAIELIKQNGKDWLDERDIPVLQLAISALQAQEAKTQLSREGSTSDCISRQAAIEALKRIRFLHLFECGEYLSEDTRVIEIISSSKALEAIEALPSAQPEKRTEERTETHACDCISRKTAIDAAIEAADEWDGGYSKERERMIRLTLLGLPSAQPEIIRCKDCKYRGGLSGFYCDIVEKAVGVDSFCSWAERKTDDLQ